ncbi:hypothetical protein [Marinomonas transparens]|uniref:Uncharacterized protein n=1 Tax=Marinomonas transparens TaxID=2795388 RepID=A0A934JRD5_9GAMM|nr:hypothetical protein [Marinomonas transparens]MBJ7536972.1 hypothetical protein [Marinomonas transparens]
MMSLQRIRKNSTKKIQTLVNKGQGIIFHKKTSRMIEDSIDSDHSVAVAADVMAWLADPKNYEDARIWLDGNELRVGGQYYFQDSFYIYFNKEDFEGELNRLDELDGIKRPVQVEASTLMTKNSNVVYLTDYVKAMKVGKTL